MKKWKSDDFFLEFMFVILISTHTVLSGAVSISIPNQSGLRGATIDIPVNAAGLANGDSLIAYQLTVTFSSSVLQSVGVTEVGTMTAPWGSPSSMSRNDTVYVGGFTTNQPNKRRILGNDILVKLSFLVVGNVGNTTTLKIHDVRLFNLQGLMANTSKTDGILTVTDNSSNTTINLVLYPGVNFVSFPLTPNPNRLPDVLGSIPVNYVWGYFSGYPKSWQAGRPGNPLEIVDGLHGYWVRLNDTVNRTLTMTGPPVAVATPIQMIKGLNLIGYLPGTQDALDHAFASLDTNYSYVWTYSAATGAPKSWLRRRPGNPLTTLTLLSAYWVRMTNPGTLIYPSSGYYLPKTSEFVLGSSPSDDSGSMSTTEWCDFWAFQPGTLQPGNTIRVYDQDGVLCGDTLIESYGGFVLPVAGDDPTTPEDEGALPGEEVQFTLNGKHVEITGTSANYDTVIIPGAKAIWESIGSKRVQIQVISGAIEETDSQYLHPEQFKLFKNHPNPFNPRTELEYELTISGRVQLDVFDIQGRRVCVLVTGFQESGRHSVFWNGKDDQNVPVPSGVYYVVLQTGQQIRVGKCLLIK